MPAWLYTVIGVAAVLLLVRIFAKSVKLLLWLAAIGVLLVLAMRFIGG